MRAMRKFISFKYISRLIMPQTHPLLFSMLSYKHRVTFEPLYKNVAILFHSKVFFSLFFRKMVDHPLFNNLKIHFIYQQV